MFFLLIFLIRDTLLSINLHIGRKASSFQYSPPKEMHRERVPHPETNIYE